MTNLFESATLKLTGWYLVIIMVVSIAFSVAIYQIAMGELSARLEVAESEIEQNLRPDLPQSLLLLIRTDQYEAASESLITGLLYVNIIILSGGGIGSYLLARRTLRPIEEANLAQARFVADASHQLRTPLAIMKAELETALRSRSLAKADTNRLITSTLEEVDRLSSLSHRLLEMSQLYDQSADTKLEVITINKLLAKVVASRNKMDNRIKLSSPRRKLYTKANPAQLEDAIDALLDNALKYSPPNSTVKVTLKKNSSQIAIKVSNTGSYIPVTDIDRIFERFYRSNKSKVSSGYGLGLAIAKKIIDAHDGKIQVESKKGGLTTFTVTLKATKQ